MFLWKFYRISTFLCTKEYLNLIVSKTGKQGIWRAICEKTPFLISSEAVFFGLLGSIPIPQHCKFFAGYAHICALQMQME